MLPEPTHKKYVEEQWKYILDTFVTCSKSLRNDNAKLLSFITASRASEEPKTVVSVIRRNYDLMINISKYLFGLALTEAKPSLSTVVNGGKLKLKFEGDLPVIGFPGYGSVIIAEVDSWPIPHRTKSLINSLADSKYYVICLDNSHQNEVSFLDPLIAQSILSGCKLGYMTDGSTHVFTTIQQSSPRFVKVRVDFTVSSGTYNRDPHMYPPVALMAAKIAEIRKMSCETYCEERRQTYSHAGEWAKRTFFDSYFGNCRVVQHFCWFSNEMKTLASQTVYCDTRNITPIKRGPGLSTQIFWVPRECLVRKNWYDVNGVWVYGSGLDEKENLEEVVVKVFDAGNYALENANASRPNTDVLLLKPIRARLYRLFKQETNQYKKIIQFNAKFGCKINTNAASFSGFYTFWQCQSKTRDSQNYIASGLTILMKKMTQKPYTQSDFLKGLRQLMFILKAGVRDLDVSYENMFMDDGKFYFCNYTPPVKEQFLVTSKMREYLDIWDKVGTGYSNVLAEVSIDRFESEMDEMEMEVLANDQVGVYTKV